MVDESIGMVDQSIGVVDESIGMVDELVGTDHRRERARAPRPVAGEVLARVVVADRADEPRLARRHRLGEPKKVIV